MSPVMVSRLNKPLKTAIEKADVLIEAAHWIRKFRDKVTVIKLGGSVMEHADALRHLLLDIVFMETVGLRPVLVHVGRVTRVDRNTIDNLCYAGIVPVIPSMCYDQNKQRLNVNADTAAQAVAAAIHAEKLVYLSDVNGVRRDKNDPDSLIDSMKA